jgi:hypothetical protein
LSSAAARGTRDTSGSSGSRATDLRVGADTGGINGVSTATGAVLDSASGPIGRVEAASKPRATSGGRNVIHGGIRRVIAAGDTPDGTVGRIMTSAGAIRHIASIAVT